MRSYGNRKRPSRWGSIGVNIGFEVVLIVVRRADSATNLAPQVGFELKYVCRLLGLPYHSPYHFTEWCPGSR